MGGGQTLIQRPLQVREFQNHEEPPVVSICVITLGLLGHRPKQLEDGDDQTFPFQHSIPKLGQIVVAHMTLIQQ
jgi:hypothetical protein